MMNLHTRKKLGKDHKFRWYIGLFKKTFMDGTLKPSLLNGQRLDVEFKMAVYSWTVSDWEAQNISRYAHLYDSPCF